MKTTSRRSVGSPRALIALPTLFILALPALSAEKPVIPGSLSAQEARAAPAPTTTLLKRIAEALDGYRNGDRLWVVIEDARPHSVAGVFTDSTEADEVRRGLVGHSQYGPYVSEGDAPDDFEFDRPQLLALSRFDGPNCPVHERPTRCDRTLIRFDETIEFDDIDSTRVQIFVGDVLYRQVSASSEVDVIFLTTSAMDKFYFPYLVRLYGTQRAADIRNELIDYLKGVTIVPRSEIVP